MTLAINCYNCAAAMINGVFCHESGCPSSWRDVRRSCRVCGLDFQPNARHETVCDNCHTESLFG